MVHEKYLHRLQVGRLSPHNFVHKQTYAKPRIQTHVRSRVHANACLNTCHDYIIPSNTFWDTATHCKYCHAMQHPTTCCAVHPTNTCQNTLRQVEKIDEINNEGYMKENESTGDWRGRGGGKRERMRERKHEQEGERGKEREKKIEKASKRASERARERKGERSKGQERERK